MRPIQRESSFAYAKLLWAIFIRVMFCFSFSFLSRYRSVCRLAAGRHLASEKTLTHKFVFALRFFYGHSYKHLSIVIAHRIPIILCILSPLSCRINSSPRAFLCWSKVLNHHKNCYSAKQTRAHAPLWSNFHVNVSYSSIILYRLE